MTTDKYCLDDIIRESHKEFKEYLKGAGIEIKGIRLRILESPDLLKELSRMINTYDINKLKQELNTIDKSLLEQISNDDDIYIINKENLREFYRDEMYLLGKIFNTDDINELNNKILKYIVGRIVYHTENDKFVDGIGVPETKEIYIIKDRLEERIDEVLKGLGPININRPSIIGLKLPLSDVIYIPLYTEGKNIEKDIAKVYAGNIIIHEMGHYIVNRESLDYEEFSVSALQYIMYIDMYNLLKHPETYEIINKNIIKCKEYIYMLALLGYRTAIVKDLQKIPPKYLEYLQSIVNVLKRAPYELGECYANIIIDRNKNLNIKDVVEEVKNLSPVDAIKKYML